MQTDVTTAYLDGARADVRAAQIGVDYVKDLLARSLEYEVEIAAKPDAQDWERHHATGRPPTLRLMLAHHEAFLKHYQDELDRLTAEQ